jgi:hypothetical protein
MGVIPVFGLRRSRHASADFTDALVDEATDIPEQKVCFANEDGVPAEALYR